MRYYIITSNGSKAFFISNNMCEISRNIRFLSYQREIKGSNCFSLLLINILPNSQVEIFLFDIQIQCSIKHWFAQIEANLLHNIVLFNSICEEAKHEITRIAKISKSEFKTILVIMIENKIIEFFTAKLDNYYDSLSKSVILGSVTSLIGPVV